MSAVFEAVGDLVEGVVDVVGDAAEWVGETVSNVVQAAMDDPLKAIAQVAVIAATGGSGAAFASSIGLSAPLTAMQASLGMAAIEGIDTLEEGGDLGDALEASAKSFAVSQVVSFGMDAFSAAGPTSTTGSSTSQFFDDGSSIQFFDDGSRLITDSAGVVSATPAVDAAVGQAAADAAVAQTANEILPASVLAGGLETFPTPDVTQIADEVLAAAEPPPSAISPENVPLAEAPPVAALADEAISPANVPLAEAPPPIAPEMIAPAAAPQYDTMEQLLVDKGLITPEEALAAVAPSASAAIPDQFDQLPDSFGDAVAMDPNAPAIDRTGGKMYDTMEDLMYDKGLINEAQYKELTGMAPVVDLSVPGAPMEDIPISDTLKELGGQALDYAMNNKLTTLAGAAALAGAGKEPPPAPGEPAKRTFTYGAAPTINRSGLEELWSAASKIYGDEKEVMNQLGIEPPKLQSSFQPNAAPLISGQAGGAGKVGLGALGQGFSYTPMGRAQTFDISTLTPEQIVQLQDMVVRKKQGEGV
jgi:hypothetical protein